MSNGTQCGIIPESVILMALDPVHVGTGGMRLGRVDNSIVREPGSRLPKIPGTSLSGAMRQYAAQRFNKKQCAGQGGHCGEPTCPICYTFGYVNSPNTGKSSAGVLSITDARILLAPVYTMAGPAWVTCPGVLQDARLVHGDIPDLSDKGKACWRDVLSKNTCLNLGWLMLERQDGDLTTSVSEAVPAAIRERMVLVCDDIFSRIVNANLEVRTSVSIDPETGAATHGALFTYEAIPRTSVLWLNIIEDDFRGDFPTQAKLEAWRNSLQEEPQGSENQLALLRKWRPLSSDEQGEKLTQRVSKTRSSIKEDLERYANGRLPAEGSWSVTGEERATHVALAGLGWAEHLGIGGMGTRGFGRIRVCSASAEGGAS